MIDNTKALQRFHERMALIGGCGDGGCVIVKPKGMHTNGGCRCHRDSLTMQRYIQCTRELIATLAPKEAP